MNRSSSVSTLRRHLKFTLGVILALFLGTAAFAQVDRAVLEGTVTDSTEAGIASDTVKILAVDTGLGQEQPTNSKGYYRFPGLAVGNYSVTFAGSGFKTKLVEGVILQVGQTRTLDSSLAVGVPTETVEVRASAAPADRS